MKKIPHRNQQNRTERTISGRILILSIIIIALFVGLAVRLVDLQIIEHGSYVQKQDDYTSIKQYTSAPRGQIYDVKGRVLAKTVPSHNIIYITPNNVDYEDSMIYADRVGEVFHLSLDDFTPSELREAYLTMLSLLDSSDPNYNGYNLLEEDELKDLNEGNMTNARLHSLQFARITDDMIKEADERDLKAAAIYNRMIANASTGQASVIAEDVDDADAAYLIEHKTEFPGFDIDLNGWKREYPYGESLSDVLGGVSTSTEGLPDSLADEFLAKGYQYNAQVGKSGLEYQYNDILTGTDEIAKITYDSNGLAHKEILQPAVKGHDIYLSIDIDLQLSLDEILKETLEENAYTKNREDFGSLFMALENPNTGDILALSGYLMDKETRKLTYYASGNYTSLINPGSCVKGVTVYMGESEGVIKEGEVVVDEPMNIGGELFASFQNHGPVDDISALSVSSNIYMFNIAMRLGGYEYKEGAPLAISNVSETLNKMRNYYSMFGLGNATGLDIPNEVTVYSGGNNTPSMVLNYAIGQLDMYSVVQMVQYASVVATGGKMYQPRFYRYSMEVNGDQVYDLNEVTLKSQLPDENASHLNRVQQGFAACVASGNCFDDLQKMDISVAAKTGTAEVGEDTTANLIGYAPVEKPSIAFACSAPISSVNSQDVSRNICADKVTGPVLRKYFELYPENAGE